MGNKKKERKEVKSTLGGQTPISAVCESKTTFTKYKCPVCFEADASFHIVNATKSIDSYWLCRICGSRSEPDLSDLPLGYLAIGVRELMPDNIKIKHRIVSARRNSYGM